MRPSSVTQSWSKYLSVASPKVTLLCDMTSIGVRFSVDSIQIATQKRAMIGNNYAPSGQLIINSNFNLPLACFGYVPDFPFCTQVEGLCLGY